MDSKKHILTSEGIYVQCFAQDCFVIGRTALGMIALIAF